MKLLSSILFASTVIGVGLALFLGRHAPPVPLWSYFFGTVGLLSALGNMVVYPMTTIGKKSE